MSFYLKINIIDFSVKGKKVFNIKIKYKSREVKRNQRVLNEKFRFTLFTNPATYINNYAKIFS